VLRTERISTAVTFVICIPVTTGSNLCRGLASRTNIFVVFLSTLCRYPDGTLKHTTAVSFRIIFLIHCGWK
jgi:hypothetical protein